MTNKLNIGCGKDWQIYKDYEGLDIVDYKQKYLINILDFFRGGVSKIQFVNQFEEVMANHFLEHFDQNELQDIFGGVYSILKDNGIFKFVVPHMDKDRAWILSHKTFWNEDTVRWLGEEETDKIYGFGKWEVVEVITNERKDIHVILRKVI